MFALGRINTCNLAITVTAVTVVAIPTPAVVRPLGW
jgi:hypothetical protein